MDLIKRIVPFVPQVVLASYLRMKVTRDGYDEESERYVIDNNRFVFTVTGSASREDVLDNGWKLHMVRS